MTKTFDMSLEEETFSELQRKTFIFQQRKNGLQMIHVVVNLFREDNDVVKVND